MMLIWSVVAAAFFVGCASATPQADKILSQHSFSSNTKVIDRVPFIEQRVAHCGPASLAMVLKWAGKEISAERLAEKVFTPCLNGSLQSDMISASRRLGMLAIPIDGFPALLEEIEAVIAGFEGSFYAALELYGKDLDQLSFMQDSAQMILMYLRKFDRVKV